MFQLQWLVSQVAHHYLDRQSLYPAHSPKLVRGCYRLFCFDIGIVVLCGSSGGFVGGKGKDEKKEIP